MDFGHSLGKMVNGAYVIASETCALEVIGAEFVRDICPGEVVIVDQAGYRVETYTEEVQPAICSMEFIYFARPDSNIAGVNVHTARKIWDVILPKKHRSKQIW